jgi:ubiquinone/menaquinone biosynthesis C-methylase UbiE
MYGKGLFDERVDVYDDWFSTPIGRLVKEYETALILEFLRPSKGDAILDAGCGSGIFTQDILEPGAVMVGLDVSLPMLVRAGEKTAGRPFYRVRGDMSDLPFGNDVFDKTVSITAIEFIRDAGGAIKELFRVTRPGGAVVVATLNSLSPWSFQRQKEAEQGRKPLFENIVFRSPDEVRALAPAEIKTAYRPLHRTTNGTVCRVQTAIHFLKNENPLRAAEIERKGRAQGLNTGAFVIARWQKPLDKALDKNR